MPTFISIFEIVEYRFQVLWMTHHFLEKNGCQLKSERVLLTKWSLMLIEKSKITVQTLRLENRSYEGSQIYFHISAR